MNPFHARVLRSCRTIGLACVAVFALDAVSLAQSPTTRPDRVTLVKEKVSPHWLDSSRFWYCNELLDGRREYVVVDAASGSREPAFDLARLATAITAVQGEAVDSERIQIDTILDSGAGWDIAIGQKTYRLDRQSYSLTPIDAQPELLPATRPATQRRGRQRQGASSQWWDNLRAPDGSQTAALENGNIFLTIGDGTRTPLSSDGTSAFAYERVFWSPDSKKLVAFRVERGDHKPVYRLESAPKHNDPADFGRAVLHTDEYLLPGDKLDSFELSIFDVSTAHQIKPQVERIDASGDGGHPWPSIRWSPDGKHFLYEKHDRGHQRLRLIEVDAESGSTRTVLDEQSSTFIWTAHTEGLRLNLLNYLRNGREVIYVSERSGWRQLYLLDIEQAVLKPITQGEWVLRGIERIDEDKRQVWFSASGVYPDQDPYFIHYGRVNFDGSGLTWLTQSNGNHALDIDQDSSAFSPGGEYVVVTHSQVNVPPVTELRRVDDGTLVTTLEKAEVGPGWNRPEVFVAKGRDEKTDIWGIIYRPSDFDSSKKYPVIEDIYAGPQAAYVPKSFSTNSRYEGLLRLGFIVVKIDGMGTAFRSKAFHDVCWKNLGDAGFPDRIKWIKAAAAKDPSMDLERVGIFGGSAGGQNAAGALLFHPEFYKVAVANCGCHDNRMDKASWNEQWMGYPVGPQYSASSNIDHAASLKGRLQLVLGELDDNVPVASTYRFVDALVRAGKEFEFVLIPGAGHGASSPVTRRKMQDFFVRHLQGVEPANPN